MTHNKTHQFVADSKRGTSTSTDEPVKKPKLTNASNGTETGSSSKKQSKDQMMVASKKSKRQKSSGKEKEKNETHLNSQKDESSNSPDAGERRLRKRENTNPLEQLQAMFPHLQRNTIARAYQRAFCNVEGTIEILLAGDSHPPNEATEKQSNKGKKDWN